LSRVLAIFLFYLQIKLLIYNKFVNFINNIFYLHFLSFFVIPSAVEGSLSNSKRDPFDFALRAPLRVTKRIGMTTEKMIKKKEE